jgi:acetyltransferase
VPVLTCWLGETAVEESRKLLSASRVPTYETPDEAVRAFMHLVRYRRNQELLLETPRRIGDSAPPDREAARAVARRALAEGRKVLTEPEAKAVLAAYGIPTVATRIARDAREAGRLAAEIGTPVALKILSPDISHKSDVGGVALGLAGAAAVAEAAEAMLRRVAEARPEAKVEGFVVQPMVARPRAQELLCGLAQDPAFGPVVLFGHGGTAAEVLADRAIGLPPLDDVLAREMIGRTKVSRLLAGYRDRPAVDLAAVADVLMTLGEIAVDLPEIAELDINPLLADADGVVCLDARIRLRGADEPAVRPAILPYPAQLTRRVEVDGQPLTVRPIRPQDAPRLVDLVDRSTPEDVRLRFVSGFRHLPATWAARLSQIDYDREVALVAEAADGEVLGVGRLVADPEGETAEFALMVRSDWQHRGLGGRLLADVLEAARARGLRQVWGDVARQNARMLELADALGFARAPAGDVSRVKVVKTLEPAPQAEPAAAP